MKDEEDTKAKLPYMALPWRAVSEEPFDLRILAADGDLVANIPQDDACFDRNPLRANNASLIIRLTTDYAIALGLIKLEGAAAKAAARDSMLVIAKDLVLQAKPIHDYFSVRKEQVAVKMPKDLWLRFQDLRHLYEA